MRASGGSIWAKVIPFAGMRRFIIQKSRKAIYLFQGIVSTIGYKLFGIEFISRQLETSDSYMTPVLLGRYGARLGRNINFKGGILIDNASKDEDATNDFSHLIIGNDCYIGKKVFFDLPNRIDIEDEVVIGAGVSVFTHADCGKRIMSRYFPRKTGPVKIGRGSWIGANATILCNVTIGEKCVVAAGSVVTRSFGPNEIVGGVPAQKMGEISERESRTKIAAGESDGGSVEIET
jgi:maltose O-acetyltransferase